MKAILCLLTILPAILDGTGLRANFGKIVRIEGTYQLKKIYAKKNTVLIAEWPVIELDDGTEVLLGSFWKHAKNKRSPREQPGWIGRRVYATGPLHREPPTHENAQNLLFPCLEPLGKMGLAPTKKVETASAGEARKADLPGNWENLSGKKAIALQVSDQGTYQWNTEKGRWMTQGSSIWLLTDKQVGTKWDFAFEKDVLVLKNPEDFRYEGAGKYFYFQMTSSKTAHKFKRVKQERSPGPRAFGGQPEIKGSLAKEEVQAVVRAHIGQIKDCRTLVLKPCPALTSKVVVDFTIGTDGRVSDARISMTTLHHPDVENCMLRRIKEWKFPKPREKPTSVSYPFVFRVN